MFLLVLVALFLIVYGTLNIALFNSYWKKIKGTPPITEKKKVVRKSIISLSGGFLIVIMIAVLCF